MSRWFARARAEEGFGIAEALVAILLFGILAVALVPPIIIAIKVSNRATVIASASSVANERIELARNASGSCAALLTFLRSTVPTYQDARGAAFTVTQTPSAATANGYVVSPSGGPGDANGDGVRDSFCQSNPIDTVEFGVEVVSTAPNSNDRASANTIIAVPGFGR